MDEKSNDQQADRARSSSEHTLPTEPRGDNEEHTSTKGVADGGESGASPRPKPVDIWHNDLRKIRLQVFLRWGALALILCTYILGVLCLYWSVLLNVNDNLASLTVFVVDFDNATDPLVGPAVTDAAAEARTQWPSIGYTMMTPDTYGGDPMRLREAVYENQAWAAIAVMPNATNSLRQAVEPGNSSYDPMGAAQFIYVEARDQMTIDSYIAPRLQKLEKQVQAKFGAQWVQQIISNSSIQVSAANLARVPQALNPTIGFTTINLRPFQPTQVTPSVSIGLIYLLIISFFSFAFFMPNHIRLLKPQGHAPVKVSHLIPWMWCASMIFYLFASCIYSLTSMAFQIPFWKDPVPGALPEDNPTAFGRGSFPVYWMINFWGMAALGLSSENVAMLVGFPWAALWLIFWVITNVSTSFYAIELSPGFFRWGYAWPLYNVVQASRQVLFDLHQSLGVHFGVLIAWAAVGTILFPFCVLFALWKQKRQMEKDAMEKGAQNHG